MNWCFRVVLVFCASCVYKTNAQITTQSCVCVPFNTCYQNLSNTGGIDIRIVNGGSGTVTVPPPTPTPFPPATLTCPAGQEVCCTPNSGCGVRYNIPLTAATTPGPGQGRYGAQPWQAVILAMDNSYVGGGVLLNNLNVLTATHKIINRTEGSIKIRLGEWNANNVVEPYPVQDIMVSRILRYPNFSASNLFNDVTLIRLATPVVIGPNPAINVACLPGAATVFDNKRCIVSGWGRDAFSGSMQSIIKEVEVPVVNSQTCQTQLQTKTKLGPSFVLNQQSFMCAGGEAGKDACVGDGGSPLMCNVGGKYQVVGLVAWGIGCGTASVPGVYVRVQSFLPWIQQNI